MSEEFNIKVKTADLPPLIYEKLLGASAGDLAEILCLGVKNFEKINSSIKGQEGEDFVETILQKHYQLINTTKKGGAGDFLIKHENKHFLIEVKNYNYPIPTSEINKFKRDLTAGASGGIFISLNSRITGYDDFVFIEKYDELNVPVIFLRTNSADLIESTITMLIKFVLLISRVKFQAGLPAQIKVKLDNIHLFADNLNVMRTHIGTIQQMVSAELNKLSTNINHLEIKLHAELLDIAALMQNENSALEELQNVLQMHNFSLQPHMRRLLISVVKDRKVSFKSSKKTLCGELNKKLYFKVNIFKHHFILNIYDVVIDQKLPDYIKYADKTLEMRIDKNSPIAEIEFFLHSM